MYLLFAARTQASQEDPAAALTLLHQQQLSLKWQVVNAEKELSQAKAALRGGQRTDPYIARLQFMEKRSSLAEVRQHLVMVSDQIAATDAEVAAHAGVAIMHEPNRIFTLKPAEFYSTLGFILWLPVFLAVARRIWRGGTLRKRRDEALDENPQMTRLAQAVEAIAIKVERIGEAQRFSAKLLEERPVEPVSERAAGPRRAMRPVITPLP